MSYHIPSCHIISDPLITYHAFLLYSPAGEIAAIITVAELPPKDSWRSLVNLIRQRETDRQTDRDRQRDWERKIERDIDREDSEIDREREIERESRREAEREKENENDKKYDREK